MEAMMVVGALRGVLSRDRSRPVLMSAELELSGGELLDRVDAAAEALPVGGVTAICLPEGPDLAVAVLAAMSVGAAAPVRADLPRRAFEGHLRRVSATTVISEPGSPAAEAASALDLDHASLGGPIGGAIDRVIEGGRAASSGPALVLTTSGTTGEPKVVPIRHTNLLASGVAVGESLELGPGDRSLLVMPLTHIHGLVAGLLAPLLAGGAVFVAGRFDPVATPRAAAGFGATYVSAVPTIHHHLAALDDADMAWARDLRFVRASSSALPRSVADALTERFGVPVVEAYGMTEAAHQITSNRPGSARLGTVGVADPAVVRIVDDNDFELATGQPGAVLIRGANVIEGYLGSDEVNDAAFIDGWFRTGDVGLIDDDGYLTLVGRTKEMINRGGETIAPVPIEEVIRSCPGVRDVVVYAAPHPSLGEQVAAAVVAEPSPPETTVIQARVADALGDAEVPRIVHLVDAVPLGPTGKVQRAQLAAHFADTSDAPLHGAVELTTDERTVIDTWREVGLVANAAGDDFVAVGGDSLLAIEVASLLGDRWGVTMHPADLLADATVRGHALARGNEAPKRQAIDGWSPIERRLLAAHRLGIDEGVANMAFAWRVEGDLDGDRLRQAMSAVVARHRALRTTYGAERVCHSGPEATSTALSWTTAVVDTEEAAVAELKGWAGERYDLANGPLVRAGAWHCGDRRWLIGIAYHHLVLDGRSRRVVLDDVAAAYAGTLDGSVVAPPLPTWRPLTESEAVWWTDRLGPAPPSLVWPEQSDAVVTVRRCLPADLLKRLDARSRSDRVTATMLLVGATAIVAHGATGADRVVVGLPIEHLPDRDQRGVGLTIDTVPVAVDVAGADSLGDVLARTRTACLESYRRADAGLQQIRRAAGQPIGMSGLHVEAQVRRIAETLDLEGLRTDALPIEPFGARSDLVVDLDVSGPMASLVVTASMSATTAEGHAEAIERLLDLLADGDGRTVAAATMTSTTGAGSALRDIDGSPPYPTVDAWFRRRVDESPRSPALSAGDRRLDVRQLDDLVRRAANGLVASSPPGARVLVELPRGIEVVVVQLAGWRVGRTIIPADPSDPPLRRALLRSVAEPDLIVHHAAEPIAQSGTISVSVEDLIAHPDTPPGGSDVHGVEPAWGCFTSGTTGRPKLVIGTQSNLVHLAHGWHRVQSPTSADTVVASKSVTTIGFLSEWIVPLLAGARVRLVDDVTARDPARMVHEIIHHEVTWFRATPRTLDAVSRRLIDNGVIAPDVRVVVSGAEVLTRPIADRVASAFPAAVLVNQYGLTEATSESTLGVVEPGLGDPDVGRPLPHVDVDVVDDDGVPAQVGAVGEIRISGPTLVEPNGSGWFATGDRGRFDAEGRLHYLGRRDRRLSVRGHRIEAGEIEAALRSTRLVEEAVASTDDAGTLVAVVVPVGDAGSAEIRRAVRSIAPGHAVPGRIVLVPSLDVTFAGKVDIDAARARAASPDPAPVASEQLRDVAAAAAVVLDRPVETVDVTASLADNGGDSFSAIELAERLSWLAGVEVDVADLLDDRPLSTLGHLTRPGFAASRLPGRLRPIAAGNGSNPLVWFPGGGGFLVEVHRLAHYLDRPPPIMAHTYAGTGPGERPRIGMGRLVRRIVAELAELGYDPPVLGGNSYGGLVATAVAAEMQRRDPGSVKGLILVDALPIEERRRLKPRWWSRAARHDLAAHVRSMRDTGGDAAERWKRTLRASRLSATGMRVSPTARGVPTMVVATAERRSLTGRDDLGWGRHLDVVESIAIPGSHGGLLVEPMVVHTAPAVRAGLDRILDELR